MSWGESLRPPRRFGRIIEAVCAQDRAYFEDHPTAQVYVREYVPGEAWPQVFKQDTAMLVQRLLPGRADARRRIPVEEHTVEQLRAVLADPRITLFVPSLGGNGHEAIT